MTASLPPDAAPGSVFFGMMGTPFRSETVTSLFRMVDAALRQGRHVTVWNCGHATGLSQISLCRPPDLFAPDAPAGTTTATLVQTLKRRYGDQLEWLVCRYCMEERGNTQQIAEAMVKIPFSFQHYLSAADSAMVLGVKS
jgi:sulfur relay (sulfurtransferase) complex TusBCD TusD component (DsrE family)